MHSLVWTLKKKRHNFEAEGLTIHMLSSGSEIPSREVSVLGEEECRAKHHNPEKQPCPSQKPLIAHGPPLCFSYMNNCMVLAGRSLLTGRNSLHWESILLYWCQIPSALYHITIENQATWQREKQINKQTAIQESNEAAAKGTETGRAGGCGRVL